MVNFFTYSIIALIILDFFALPLACFLDNQIDKINKNKNPMEQPITVGIRKEKINKNTRTIYFKCYIQYQLKKDGKWILHNTNGPAVIDSVNEETAYFINGIEYTNELQYLVAKGDYENKEEL